MTKNRQLLTLLLSLLLAVGLTACSGGGNTTAPIAGSDASTAASQSSEAAPTASTLPKMSMWTTTGRDTYDEVLALYKEQTGVEIERTPYAGIDYWQKIRVAAASGTQPNIWSWWGGEIAADFLYKGQSVDLMEYADKYNWTEKFIPWTYEHLVRDGKLGAVPAGVGGIGLIYRKDIYEKYGISIPKTYDEFLNVCQTLADNGVASISNNAQEGWMFMRATDVLMDKFCGPELHNQLLQKKASWDCPEVVRAYEELKMYADKGYFPEGFLSGTPAESKLAVYSGTAAGTLDGNWFGATLIEDGMDIDNYGVYAIPTDAGTIRFSGGVETFILGNVGTKETQDACAEFLEWFTSKDTIDEIGLEKYALMPALQVYDMSEANCDSIQLQVLEIIKTGDAIMFSDQAFSDELARKYFEVEDAVVLGTMTPAEAAKEMQAAVDAEAD